MTREQAIIRLRRISTSLNKYCDVNDCIRGGCAKCYDALDMAEKALEQEPKCGKWLDDNNSFNSFYANCSECGYQMDKHAERGYHNYCPYCGARMRSGEE